jgi:hypothetical protein
VSKLTSASASADQALAVPAEPGSTVSALTGFDPSRKDDVWNVQRDIERRARAMRDGVAAAKALYWLQSYGLNPFCGSTYGENFGGYAEAKPYIAATTESFADQLRQRAIDLALADVEAAYASAIEARSDATGTGAAEGESAPEGDAQDA